MAAVAESQVLVGVGARNIETVRIKENRRVAVGGCVVHDHLLARGDPLATEHPTVALVPFPVRSPQPRRSVTAQARVLTHSKSLRIDAEFTPQVGRAARIHGAAKTCCRD